MRIMITSIIVRNLETNKHSTNRYTVISIYFNEKDQYDNDVRIKIIKAIHLINDLKINILLENDVFDSELFDISMSTNTIYIKSCKITISIKITTQRSFVSKFVHFIKFTIISSNLERFISIHKITSNRNYLFEFFDSTNFSIYVHLIDNEINFVIVRNNSSKFLKISRNFKLNILFESVYINAFQIDAQMFDITLKHFKFKHKTL